MKPDHTLNFDVESTDVTDALSEVGLNTQLLLLLLGLTGFLVLITQLPLTQLAGELLRRLRSSQVREAYTQIVEPFQGFFTSVIVLMSVELVYLFGPKTELLNLSEFLISLTLAIVAIWLSSQLFKEFFERYWLDASLNSGRKVNSELLVLAKVGSTSLIIIIVTIIFAQTHHLNPFGLIASLGVGGIAVGFASRETLEQLLGGIVIYLDRPFVIDDYISFKDGRSTIFGRVESIGLRSTKVRTSGKGSLVIIPNNSLTKANIENFTDAKKVISLIKLIFYRKIPNEEKALMRRVILESTGGIFGLDSRSTDVSFRSFPSQINQEITQAQVTLFLLGAGEVSLELRRQVLDVANQKITRRLKEFGITFDSEEPTIYVDSPITI